MKWRHYHITPNGIQTQFNGWWKHWPGIISSLLLLILTNQGMAQSVYVTDTSYRSRVHYLVNESREFIQDEQYRRAERKAQEALSLSQRENYAEGEIESVNALSALYQQQKDYLKSVKYSLWALRVLERVGDQTRIMRKYEKIGYLYFGLQAYQKAIDYFLVFQKVREKTLGKSELPPEILEIMGEAYLRLQEYTQVQHYNSQLLRLYQASKDTANLIKTYRVLAFVAKEKLAYEEAIGHNQELLKIYQGQRDMVQLTYAYNNIGFLYKRADNLKMSLEYFQKAITLKEKLNEVMDAGAQASLLTNIGVAYTNLSLYLRAKDYYGQALRLQQQQGDRVGEAHSYNHLASNYFVSGKNAQALQAVTTAIDIGVTYNAQATLATSYQILSLIYEADDNENKARLYKEKFREISESLEDKKVAQFEDMLDRQLAIEKQEDQIKSSLAEQERRSLEEERKENELALLRRDQELQAIAFQNQQLEKERATQALALAQEQLRAEKRNRELRESERQRQLQDLRFQQQDLEQQQQQKTIALLEADQQLKEQKLQEEATMRKYGYGIIGLILVVLGIIIYSFIQKKKDNRKLQQQQDEIQEKNDRLLSSEKELRQNMEQLQSAQVILEDQKWQLEEQKLQLEIEYRKTQESIRYAKRIQFSILPSEQQCAAIVPENFVIYRPKDIVSGDFYWVSQLDTKKIVSVIDCTGHGVPGSLVSLIGNNLLNEAINEHSLTDPAEILRYLDVKVRQKLRHDEEKNRDGMDMGICVLEEVGGEILMNYGGAKNTLFIVMNDQLHVVKGDTKSIGDKRKEKSFTQQQIRLKPGDCVYLTTDGYIDQANPERERFGSKRLRQLINEINHLPMAEQGIRFEAALDAHQQDVEQRDDINLIGIRV
ncbi:MAG: SpoIIE family protein phosphatase [Bacteroidota bacterium]